MEHIAQLHMRLQVTILLVMLVLTGWGLLNYLRKLPVTSNYQAGLIIGQLLLLSEALLGLILLFRGAFPARFSLHLIYGAVAVLCLPAAFLYTRGRDGRFTGLIYAGTCLFLAGVAIRAFETGQ